MSPIELKGAPVRSGSQERSRPALFAAALMIVLSLLQGIVAVRHSGEMRDVGWRGVPTDSGSLVVEVIPGGPAMGLLQPGDRVIAINGHHSAAIVGPQWILGPQTAGREYSLRVLRTGKIQDVALRVEQRTDPQFAPWGLLYFVIAWVYLAVGATIIWQRSEDLTARYCFLACMATTAIMLHLTSRRDDSALSGSALVLSQLLLCFYPLHFLFGYLFLSRFPLPIKQGRVWRIATIVIIGGCALTWLARVTRAVLTALGDRGVAFVIENTWVARGLDKVMLPIEAFAMLAVCVGCVAVTAHNYRTLNDPSQRRRLRWLAVGLAAAVIPIGAVQLARIITGAVLKGGVDTGSIRWALQFANAFVIIQPLALAYAVLRHRVLGVHVAFRIGVQYMLAKSVLQAVLLLPMLWFFVHIARNRSLTMTELMFGETSRLSAVVLFGAALTLRFRPRIGASIDRRFFREAYDQERILLSLVDEVPQAESIDQLSRLVAAQLTNALHPASVHLLYLDKSHSVIAGGSLPDPAALGMKFDLASRLLAAIENEGRPMEFRHLASHSTDDEQVELNGVGADVIAPILGLNGRLRGLLILGSKRSEEPYTAKDRALLRTITAQIGAVHEVLELREAVNSERRIQHEVLARLQEASVDVLRECLRCGACHNRDTKVCDRDGSDLQFTLPVPSTIDAKYRLTQRIGNGGMGAVYDAIDERLQRPVAVKIMLSYLFGSTTAQRRFEREARASARIEHPNIVRTYDYGTLSSGGAYLVMERIYGRQWRECVFGTHVNRLHVLAVLLDQLCGAVSAAHSAGVIHRDLKPANIMVAGDAQEPSVKVLDFGVAKIRAAFDLHTDSETIMSGVAGTLGYVAPELLAGATADERADVYSLGVIAIEALTGSFTSLAQLDREILESTVSSHFEARSNGLSSARIAEVLRRSIAADRKARYQSVAALRSEIIPEIVNLGRAAQ